MRAGEINAIAHASRDLLAHSDPVGAERLLSPIFNELKSDASIIHLMGLIMKAQNRLDQAERYLRAAVANSLNEGPYYNDLAVVLQARGSYTEAVRVFRAAIALLPGVDVTRVNLVHCLLAAGDFAEAEREARSFIALLPGAESWTLLATVLRALDRREEALAASANALQFSPKDRALRTNHAIALDRAGRVDEAIKAYEGLATQALDSPDLALNLARALYGRRRKNDAESVLVEAVKHWPLSAPLQGTLARVRAMRGEGEAATAFIEAEIARRPDEASLYLMCADALHRGGYDQKAEAVLDAALARTPDSPPLLTALGIVLDELDRPKEGLAALRRAHELSGGGPTAQRNLLSTLLRAGEPEEALRVLAPLRAEDRDEQYLIASEALAWRMLGRADYCKLYDYERFVRTYEIPAPRGFFNVENFNAALADTLRVVHRTWAHPLDQSLHEGAQTSRSLLTIDEPNLKAWFAAIDAAIRSYISELKPSPDEPLTRRRTERYRFANAWSVRLTRGGFQPNHVHDRGWISAAYYAALPDLDGRQGWLKFGEPNRPLPGCTVDHVVQPKVGALILFPSYMWHGTYPFDGAGERLSAAFDVIPA